MPISFSSLLNKDMHHFLSIAKQTLSQLGASVAINKTEVPLTFLGILVDCQLKLPEDKLLRVQDIVCAWIHKRSCTRKELESLAGHLSHAATVIPQGRTFPCQLFSLLSLNRLHHHRIRLNAGTRADLMWWEPFLQSWNGKSFFPIESPSLEIVSDASGSFGCGAFSIPHGWIQLQWPIHWREIGITANELVPIVIAAAVWGQHWTRRCVSFRSDNMAVIHIL